MTDRIKSAESIAHAISRKTVSSHLSALYFGVTPLLRPVSDISKLTQRCARAITWTGTASSIIQFAQFLWGVVWALLGRRWEKKKEEKEEERRVTAAAADEERWAEKTDQLTKLVEEILRVEGVDNAKTTAINSLHRQVTEQRVEIKALRVANDILQRRAEAVPGWQPGDAPTSTE
ncbi:hypothetical protein BDR22DRAFT_817921 [Usnea florida]